MTQLDLDSAWRVVGDMILIFQSAEFKFCSFSAMFRTRKDCSKLAPKRSEGDFISAGFK